MTDIRLKYRHGLNGLVISITMYSLIAAALVIAATAAEGLFDSSTEVGALGQARVDYGPSEISDRASATMGQIDYPWQDRLPGWTIEFVQGDSEIAGYTWSKQKRIEIFVRKESTPESLVRVLAHEFGHAVDVSLNDGDERRSWLIQRQAQDRQWWPDSGKADFQTGAGDFAEVFAVWMTDDSSDFRSQVGPNPSQADLELLEKLVGA